MGNGRYLFANHVIIRDRKWYVKRGVGLTISGIIILEIFYRMKHYLQMIYSPNHEWFYTVSIETDGPGVRETYDAKRSDEVEIGTL